MTPGPERRSDARGVPFQRRPEILVLLGLAAATLATFSPALRAGFVFDDRQYLLENAAVQHGLTWGSTAWAFTSFHAANWHPLTWISHLLDVSLFGLRPAGHHLVNLLLHALNAGLLFLVLRRMTGAAGRSALAAALFALHPLRVESVAWVAERKDLLSACFFLLALAGYRRYVRRPGLQRYLPVALLFALGLLAKPMLVTVPCVLLLLDWWPLGRLGHRISWGRLGTLALEKLPLFALSAGSAWITLLAQRAGGAVAPWEGLTATTRLANAAVAYAVYLGKALWPASLAAFYPYPRGGHPPVVVAASVAILSGLTVVGLKLAGRRPGLLTGWLWFAGTLVPAIGLVQVGGQALADRYLYLPFIGIVVAALWGLAGLPGGNAVTLRAVLPSAAVTLLAFASISWRQSGYWLDQRTLFEHAAATTAGNYVAQFALGAAADEGGRADEAIAHYREAVRFHPRFFDAQLRLGNALARRGDGEGAIAAFRQALESWPRSTEALVNLGAALAQAKRYDEALDAYRRALELKPELVEAYMNIGNVLSDLGRDEQALGWYAQALRHGSGRAEAHFNLAVSLERLGRGEAAAGEYREALRLRPDYPQARLGLARVRATAEP